MRNFTLKVLRTRNSFDDSRIITTAYETIVTTYINDLRNNNFIQPYSTFNEKLTEKENDQFEFTFSIANYVLDGGEFVYNHWLDIIKIGSKLILDIDSKTQSIHLIVSKITPSIGKNNIIYQFTAQDEVSYKWTRIRLGYSYTNLEPMGNRKAGVQNIYEIVSNVFDDNFLQGQWDCIDTEGVKDYIENTLRHKKISLEVLDSNPYNVIIEACNTLGCYMKVNYTQRYITFYQKNDINFSGYRYRPENTLSTFTVNYDANELSTMLHVVGGTNEYEELITLVPAVPTELMLWLIEEQYDLLSEKSNIWEKIVVRLPKSNNTSVRRIGSPIEKYKDEDGKSVYDTTPEGQIKYYYKNILLYTEDDPDAVSNYNELRNSIVLTEEGQVIENFLIIARQVPHLGQFLYDFSYFRKTKIMTVKEFEKLDENFNFLMRNNNIYLKYYIPLRYRLQYEINKSFNTITTTATNFYGAELQTTFDKDNTTIILSYINSESSQAKRMEYQNNITNILKDDTYKLFRDMISIHGWDSKKYTTLYKEKGTIQYSYNDAYNNDFITLHVYSSSFPEIQSLLDDKLYYEKRFVDSISRYKILNTETYKRNSNILTILESEKSVGITGEGIVEEKRSDTEYKETIEYNNINLEKYTELVLLVRSELELLESRLQTYVKLVGDPTNSNITNTSAYQWLLNILNNNFNECEQPEIYKGFDSIIDYYETKNTHLWEEVYTYFGQYIYEAKYENADELDSLSLYNQGIAHFENQKLPSAAYSVSTIDIGSLELIGLPRLSIGSKIRVYNEDLNLVDSQPDPNDTTKFIRGEDCISFNNNDLIVTQISTTLRESAKITISVEQISPYNKIVSKLLQSVRL